MQTNKYINSKSQQNYKGMIYGKNNALSHKMQYVSTRIFHLKEMDKMSN